MKWNDTLETIYNELGSDKPAPGGGSASAISGFVACGLLSMLEKLNPEPEVKDQAAPRSMEENAKDFIMLAEKDAQAYLGIVDAFKLPKETDEQKNTRREAVMKATVNATIVPMKTGEHSLMMLGELIKIAGRMKKSMISDLEVAYGMLRACFLGAMMNVKINLPGIKDEKIIMKFANRMKFLASGWQRGTLKLKSILKEREISF
ncbi:MAG: cyclodeaminase/cyclohydrolase family protein [Chloroflexi bacterium]|nr:cyclodeaminase/cyclohydrolase family protein [Chloroflexota bacterium]